MDGCTRSLGRMNERMVCENPKENPAGEGQRDNSALVYKSDSRCFVQNHIGDEEEGGGRLLESVYRRYSLCSIHDTQCVLGE